MGMTANFMQQHEDILRIAKEMSKLLDPNILGKDAQPVRSLLSTLSVKLKIHLASEDRSLYPELLNHKDANVKATTKKFMDEMGGISAVFVKYTEKWVSADTIQKNPNDFIKETEGLFSALAKRIEKENRELYPLVDK